MTGKRKNIRVYIQERWALGLKLDGVYHLIGSYGLIGERDNHSVKTYRTREDARDARRYWTSWRLEKPQVIKVEVEVRIRKAAKAAGGKR